MSELGWYRPSETVFIEGQLREVGQVSEFGWYRPTKTVGIEVQLREVGQVSEFGRQCTIQPSTNKDDGRDVLRGSC